MYFLRDEEVGLRKLSLEDDLDSYLALINDTENLVWLNGSGNFPLNKEDIRRYLEGTENILFGIFNSEGVHVGNIQLSHINLQHRNAMLGIVVGRKFQGKGYAKRACKLLIMHAFEVLNLHRIYLTVVAENKGAISLYEGLGFVEEGVEKDIHLYESRYYDGIRYRLLEDAYRKMEEA